MNNLEVNLHSDKIYFSRYPINVSPDKYINAKNIQNNKEIDIKAIYEFRQKCICSFLRRLIERFEICNLLLTKGDEQYSLVEILIKPFHFCKYNVNAHDCNLKDWCNFILAFSQEKTNKENYQLLDGFISDNFNIKLPYSDLKPITKELKSFLKKSDISKLNICKNKPCLLVSNSNSGSEYILDVQKCIDNKMPLAALALSIILPEIAINKANSNGDEYSNWCDKYVVKRLNCDKVIGKHIYNIRNEFAHCGNLKSCNEQENVNIQLGLGDSESKIVKNENEYTFYLSIYQFCQVIIEGFKECDANTQLSDSVNLYSFVE